MAPPHAFGSSRSPPRQTFPRKSLDSEATWQEETEQQIRNNTPIRQAKAVNLTDADSESLWVSAVSLHPAENEGPSTVDTTRQSLQKLKKTPGDTQFVIPEQWIVMQTLPMTATGAIDEPLLRQSLAHFHDDSALQWKNEVISMLRTIQSKETIDSTITIHILALLWARVLRIDAHNITAHDRFTTLGGSHRAALELSELADTLGLDISVPIIMQNQELAKMADAVEWRENRGKPTQPFELLSELNVDEITAKIHKACKLRDYQTIEDVFPCSHLQEALMDLTWRHPGSHSMSRTFELPSYIDITKFKMAWETTIRKYPNLRARIVKVDGMLLQVVVRDEIEWDLVRSLAQDPCLDVRFGSRLCRYALGRVEPSGPIKFIWQAHNTIYDAWGVGLILQTLSAAYNNEPSTDVVLTSAAAFIESTRASSAAEKAIAYWESILTGAKHATFPPKAESLRFDQGGRFDHFRTSVELPKPRRNQSNMASIVRGAWALLLARYCETNDICFGVAVSGRDATGLERNPGPTVATVPVRVEIHQTGSVADFLSRIQILDFGRIGYEHYDLQKMKQLSPEIRDACNFSSILSVEPEVSLAAHDTKLNVPILEMGDFTEEVRKSFPNYPLFVHAQICGTSSIDLILSYDTSSIIGTQAEALANQLAHVIQQLCGADDMALVEDVSLTSTRDIEQVNRWNQEQPAFYEEVRSCPHERFIEQVQKTPDAEAVYSTSTTLTYRQLHEQSNAVAQHLIRRGIAGNAVLPFCVEKSALAIIVMLAISKAGAAFVHLDSTHPPARRQALCDLVEAQYIITSPFLAPHLGNMKQDTIEITDDILHDHSLYDITTLPTASPLSDMYIIFSSGSTGTPKCIPMQHGAAMSTLIAQLDALAIPDRVRMLQFTSFNFDVSIIEAFLAFFSGGTICVPSERERLESTAAFATEARVNHAILTPSFARTMAPENYPTLKTLVLFGEKLTADLVYAWQPQTTLINSYGLTESGMLNTTKLITSSESLPTDVGRGFNCHCWIVEQGSPGKLTPVGCTGELVLHGFAMSRGFLNAPELTAKAFPSSMPWELQEMNLRNWKYNRTGDLARFLPNGNIEIITRSDTQVKIRGRRVDVTEIETAVKQANPHINHIAVDLIMTSSKQVLVAFMELNDVVSPRTGSEGAVMERNSVMKQLFDHIQKELQGILPAYMIPSVYIPLRAMLFSGSMKTDRRQLRQLALQMSADEISHYTLLDSEVVEPTTEAESVLRELWEEVLKVPAERIGKTTTFLDAGGDSINVIQLATLARERGFALTAAQIFQNPRLQDMAVVVLPYESSKNNVLASLELLEEMGLDVNYTVEQARLQCNLYTTAEIEDILPTSSLQEGLLVEEMKYPGTYTTHRATQLPKDLDIERFKVAWEKTVEACTCLRTRLVRINGSTLQVVIKGSTGWLADSEMAACELDDLSTMPPPENSLGQPMCRYGIAERRGVYYFVWSLHHAIYDGWTLSLVSDLVQKFYEDLNSSLTMTSPSYFIQSIQNIDADKATKFWRNELQGAQPSLFPPPLPIAKSRKRATHAIHTHKFASAGSTAITKATILRAAWGILLTKYSDSDDICFGQVLSGRQADLAGIEKMAGLALATVPARLRLDASQPVEEMLVQMQHTTAETIEFEQFGLPNIAQTCTEAKDACSFTSMFAVQPSVGDLFGEESSMIISLENDIENSLPKYLSYSLSLQVEVRSSSFTTYFTYDLDSFHAQQVEAMVHQYARIVEQLTVPGSLTVGDLSAVSEWDILQIKKWNNEMVAEPVEACLHSMLSEALQAQPEKTAIVTTAGSMTYGELDHLSTRFAQYLVSIGAKEGMIIPFLFEKSTWAFVAFIGILKAGAAFLPLDVSYPAARRQILVEETEAEIMVVSTAQRQGCEGLVKTVIELSLAFFTELSGEYSTVALPKVSPLSAMYAFFTSGSTGKPKGIILEHAAVATSVLAHIKAYGLTEETRILQFCSYMFDIIVIDTFGVLLAGGTICAPTEEERLYDCASFMNFARVNYAVLTPTFARTLDPSSLKTLKTLLMGAEAIPKDVQDMWYGKVQVKYGYGPTEAAVSNTIYTVTSPDTPSTIIGKGFNTDCWIVEPDNHNRLVPVGCVGELVLHGYNLARGYLNNKAATDKAFPKDVDWMPRRNGDKRKFYKTGDLVKFRADGNIEFLSRKDTQVKIRGRRIELGEIETAIKNALPSATGIAVEVIRLESRDFLAAFIESSDSSRNKDGNLLLAVDAVMRQSMAAVMFQLNNNMPSYLVPSVYVPISKIPLLPSMKMDRKTLQSIGKALTSKQLTEYSFASTKRVNPTTEVEFKLRDLWARVLKREPADISRHDSFLTVGGDSITAMELVAQARKANLSFTVQDIFRSPKLDELALLIRDKTPERNEIAPFDLLPVEYREIITQRAKESLLLTADEQILDIYPATPMQERLMAAAEKSPGSYIALQSFRLLESADVERFIQAWNLTVESCTNLRTRMILSAGRTWQVVLKTQQPCIHRVDDTLGVSEALTALLAPLMSYGSPLSRFKLARSGNSVFLLFAMHHSIFDGWSMNIILKTLHDAYRSQALYPTVPYTGFIQHIFSRNKESTKAFWTKQLDGVKHHVFPIPRPSTRNIVHDPRLLVQSTQLPSLINSSFTLPTVVRAAWSIILSRYFGTSDVCFSDTMSGRLASVDGIENMSGLTISMVPFRVRLRKSQLIQSFLKDIQAQASDMIPHEQFGLHNIAKLGHGIKEALDCGHALVIQPSQNIEAQLQRLGGDSGQIMELCVSEDETLLEDATRYDSFPLFVNCQILGSSLRTSYVYNASCMSEKEVAALSHHMDTAITQLLNDTEKTINDVSIAADWDIDQMNTWNRTGAIVMSKPLSDSLALQSVPEAVWILDSHNPNSLAAVGCVGELLLQFNDTVLRPQEYEIVENDVVTPMIPPDHFLVKTNKIVRCSADGSLDYVGGLKRDNKASKYSDVEDFVVANAPLISGARFATLTIESAPVLVAFIQPTLAAFECLEGMTESEELLDIIQSTFQITQKRWPSHIIPQYVIPLSSLTKNDAPIETRELQDIVSQLAPKVLASCGIRKRAIVAPSSAVEAELRELWAVALSLQVSDISSKDNFFQVGGDSFTAIQLASQARRQGLNLTARAVFQNPVLADMAASLDDNIQNAAFNAAPFSLMQGINLEELKSSVAKLCGLVDVTKVEDIYPCTPMQEGLMSLTVTRPGSYINKECNPLTPGVDISRFKNAWNRMIRLCENMRTRIVLINDYALQVVVNEDPIWDTHTSLAKSKIGYGSRLCYYSLDKQSDGTHTFSFLIHHSIYDGWVLGLMNQVLESVYHQRPPPTLQRFSGFVKYLNSVDKQAASDYWKLKLQGVKPSSFPTKMSNAKNGIAAKNAQTMKKTITFSKDSRLAVTSANIVIAAWSLVMARYSDTDDICFGSTVSGRQASVSGLEQMAGPMITTVPVRTKIDKTLSIMQFLEQVQEEISKGSAFEQFGLQNISKLGADAKVACDFTSLLIIQTAHAAEEEGDHRNRILFERSTEDLLNEAASRNFFNYPLVAQVFPSEDSVDLFLAYDGDRIPEGELLAFTHQFGHIIKQLFSEIERPLSEISYISEWDQYHAVQSGRLRAVSGSCVHQRFQNTVNLYGDLPAINSWDANFTYRELYESSYVLAQMLQKRGVGRNVVVPVCFAKSSWAIVSMMAIQLAGGAFVPLDPESPTMRLQSLLSDLNAPFILASKSFKEKLRSCDIEVLMINKNVINALPRTGTLHPGTTEPADTSFLIFTSGTTGKPKAVDISHGAICSSSDGYGASLNIGPGTRVFQFSAYTFDVAILDILVTLTRGGCVCVPSDYSRVHELAASINSMRANWGFLTPTVANLLSPRDVPSLTTLCLGGEAVGESVANKWKDSVHLHGLYGPAESSICAWRPRLGQEGKSTNIGRPLSSAFWVVEPNNHKQLVPIGCIGELLVQGPLLAEGYRNTNTQDQEKWLENCDFLPGALSRRGYLTGDLVRRNADGTYDYMGRKDSQVKLRGQRIETGEIEYHILQSLLSVKQVAVDIIGSGASEALAAFISFGSRKPSEKASRRMFAEAIDHLALHLPVSMIPQYFIPLETIPQTSTGKLDRRALRASTPTMDAAELLRYSVIRSATSRNCETPLELELRRYWSQVLGLPEESIGATDNFYSLGGDSIRIVSLVQRIKMAHGGGMGISVFGSSKTTIEVMARLIETHKAGGEPVEASMHDFYGEITSALESLSDIDDLEQRCSKPLPPSATIFLTGATGYLGTEILHQLVDHSGIGSIAVLVRARTQELAMGRIRTTAETAGWWKPEHESKIEVWLGDLGKEQLGLNGSQYSRLLGLSVGKTVDAIIHNGAVVNWSADFHALKAENVTSTIQLLQVTAASPREPKFVFVSGGTGAKRDGTRSAEDMCKDLSNQNGYSQTKFISESIVCELAKKLPSCQNRIAVVKPGLIIGTSSSGVANVDDFLWRLAAASVALNRAPDLGGGQDWVQLAAVDSVANAIIKPVLAEGGVQVFTEITNGMRMTAMWKLVGEAVGVELPLLPYAEWHAAALRQMEEVGERHPLWAAQDFLEFGDVASHSEEMMSINAPLAGTADAIKSSVRYLQRIGFIQKAAVDFGAVNQPIIGRSSIRAGQ